MLHTVIGLSEVCKNSSQRIVLESGAINETVKSKLLMLCGHSGAAACLARSPQASVFSPPDNAALRVAAYDLQRGSATATGQ